MDPSHIQGSSSSPSRDQTRGVRFTEEQPTHHIYQSQPRRTSPRNSPTHGKAPEVYWADDDDRDGRRDTIISNNPADGQYTFFREGSPTPPEYNDEHEKGLAVDRAAAGSAAAGSYATRSTVGGSLPPVEDSRGCIGRYQQKWGMRRGVFWAIIIAAILLVIVLPLGVGLGVGLSKSSKSSATDPSPSGYEMIICSFSGPYANTYQIAHKPPFPYQAVPYHLPAPRRFPVTLKQQSQPQRPPQAAPPRQTANHDQQPIPTVRPPTTQCTESLG